MLHRVCYGNFPTSLWNLNICIVHLPWATIGVGITVVPSIDEVTVYEKLVLLVNEYGLSTIVPI